ncbi:hypothetical protein K432DRAFT_447616, partial [Lepidopterella palustris CBS 459.81]
MALGETLHFDEAKYKQKIRALSIPELQEREVAKHRQIVSSNYSIAVGGVVGLATGGVGFVGSAYGVRRSYIANKKLELLINELAQRGVELYKMKAKDYIIPLASGAAGTAVGIGIADGLASHFTSTAATQAFASHSAAVHGTNAVNAALGDPTHFAEGLKIGIEGQSHEMANIGTIGVHGASETAAMHSAALADPSIQALPTSEIIGASVGMATMQTAEVHLVSLLASNAWRIVGNNGSRSQPITILSPPGTCTRMSNLTDFVWCAHCISPIDRSNSSFYHCCLCTTNSGSDNFDACASCVEVYHRECLHPDQHVLHKIFASNKPCDCKQVAPTIKRWPYSFLVCYYCHSSIAQMDYYHCCSCANDQFILCINCQSRGLRCLDPSHQA